MTTPSDTQLVDEALSRLGTRRLLLAIHDASFPSAPEEEIGRGSPYGLGAERFFAFLRAVGFGGVQFGPQGETSQVNPSPYDGALFTRSVLSVAPATLLREPEWEALGTAAELSLPALLPGGAPRDRVQYGHAFTAGRAVLQALADRFRAHGGALAEPFSSFCASEAAWLGPDGLFEALTAAHGTDDFRRWGDRDSRLYCPDESGSEAARRRRREIAGQHPDVLALHAFGQWVLELQHARMRGEARRLGLELFGDLQIGVSQRDLWSRRALFLADYLMGAPPSRTNPEGQPWGFPVLDPKQYCEGECARGEPGPVLAFFRMRIGRIFEHFDGVRIDHPHGLVDPWVYKADDPDPLHAVQNGARLFSSPDLPDHPDLARFAIPSRAQLAADGEVPRYADGWVRALTADQVARYAILFDAIVAETRARGRSERDIKPEVLSTWPYQLRQVMERDALGRFRITQKANLTVASDPYRSDNAEPQDWIMVGNHDTKPLFLLADGWHGTAAGAARAAFLAARLVPDPTARPAFAHWCEADPRHLCQAMFAELFASRAENVSVFFADLFGMREVYNQPGTVSDENWTLRVPSDFEGEYAARLRRGEAMNLPLALRLALHAKGGGDDALSRLLDERARALSPGLTMPP